MAPDRVDELGDLATKSPNEVRRRFDALLAEHPVAPGVEEAVLQVAWAYGERRFIRSLARQVSPASRRRAEGWARARIGKRKGERRKEREADDALAFLDQFRTDRSL